MNKKIFAAAVLVSLGAASFGQQTGFYSDGRPEKIFNPVSGVASMDVKFLKTAQAGNQFEILSSQLALTNASSDFVKEFAKEMITDHGAAKEEVSQVASQKSLNVSGELPKMLQTKLNQLKMLKGDAFDKLYRADQKEAHEMTAQLLKSEIDHGHDQDVKAVAVKLLPTVELHYHMLISGKTMMGSTAASGGGL
jgi:putative membrane protein